ncbi:hypothetical protein [Alteriqipengyuania sp.]
MAYSIELIVLALAGYALGLGLGALAHVVWTLRGPDFRVNAGERKR